MKSKVGKKVPVKETAEFGSGQVTIPVSPRDYDEEFKSLALWALEHGAVHIETNGRKIIFHPDHVLAMSKKPEVAPEEPKRELTKEEKERKFDATLFRSSG